MRHALSHCRKTLMIGAVMAALAAPAFAGNDECMTTGGNPGNQGGMCSDSNNNLGTCDGGICVTGNEAPEMPAILLPVFVLAAAKIAHSARKRSQKRKAKDNDSVV